MLVKGVERRFYIKMCFSLKEINIDRLYWCGRISRGAAYETIQWHPARHHAGHRPENGLFREHGVPRAAQ